MQQLTFIDKPLPYQDNDTESQRDKELRRLNPRYHIQLNYYRKKYGAYSAAETKKMHCSGSIHNQHPPF